MEFTKEITVEIQLKEVRVHIVTLKMMVKVIQDRNLVWFHLAAHNHHPRLLVFAEYMQQIKQTMPLDTIKIMAPMSDRCTVVNVRRMINLAAIDHSTLKRARNSLADSTFGAMPK